MGENGCVEVEKDEAAILFINIVQQRAMEEVNTQLRGCVDKGMLHPSCKSQINTSVRLITTSRYHTILNR